MNICRLLPLVLSVLAAAASATTFERHVQGGRFVECEFVGLGSKGDVSGELLISQTSTDPKWAAGIALRLQDNSKFQVSFRLALLSVTTSKNLELRYEYFAGSRRPVTEALAEVPVGQSLPFRLTWDETGRITISVAGRDPRNLLLDFNPTMATVLITGASAKLKTEGREVLGCTQKEDPKPAK